jgi:very-short-patch-repair endonuclease
MEKSVLRQRARDERHLWYYLRASRLGFKFKRQGPIGEYIVDVVCLEKRLIIELDGGQHRDNQIYHRAFSPSIRPVDISQAWVILRVAIILSFCLVLFAQISCLKLDNRLAIVLRFKLKSAQK